MVSLRSNARKGLTVLNLPRTVLLKTDRLDGNEAGCILRCPVHVQRVHATLILGVKVGGLAGTSNDVGRSLVGDEAHFALNLALREFDGMFNKLAFGAEVHAWLTS